MGREATIDYAAGRERAKVRAHLDSMALELSGGKKLVVPLSEVRSATVSGEELKIEAKGAKFALRLGAKEAASWAKKILNPPTLADKLGIRADTAVLIVGDPIKEIDAAAPKAGRASTLTAAKAKAANIVILTLAPETAAREIAAAAKVLPEGTALWLAYAKGTKPNGDGIIALARKAGLKDTKVARISDIHAALRFIAGDRK
jgi:phage-related tail fiber protein